MREVKTPFGEYDRVAWTGGSFPPVDFEVERPEYAALVEAYFEEQKKEWEEYWEEDLPSDVEEIFMNRARHDAWATLRSRGEFR